MSETEASRFQDNELEGEKQFVVFQVAGEEYGVDALRVLEIIGVSIITRVPHVPRFVRGVTDLRGTIMPVMDLRLKLGYPEADYNRYTSMIVLQLDEGTLGIIADSVSDMLALPETAMVPPRDMGLKGGAGLIGGVGTVEGRIVMLLDVDRLFSSEEAGGASN